MKPVRHLTFLIFLAVVGFFAFILFLRILREPRLNKEIFEHLFEYNPALSTNYSRITPKSLESAVRKKPPNMATFVYERLHYKSEGFFVESGAYDGEYLSNTAFLERAYGWTGLLVESDPEILPILKYRNRRAWIADVCLSTVPYPTKVNMSGSASASHPISRIENDVMGEHSRKLLVRKFQVQCYPLHMILDAIGRNTVDYLSLDVEGVDLPVLKTIPWNRIKIKIISVETWDKNREPIRAYLETVGYRRVTVLQNDDGKADDVYELED